MSFSFGVFYDPNDLISSLIFTYIILRLPNCLSNDGALKELRSKLTIISFITDYYYLDY